MTTETKQTQQSYADRYPYGPLPLALLQDSIYSVEDLGTLCRASAFLWTGSLPDNPQQAADLLGISKEKWTDRTMQLMWHTFRQSTLNWMRVNERKSETNSANARKGRTRGESGSPDDSSTLNTPASNADGSVGAEGEEAKNLAEWNRKINGGKP